MPVITYGECKVVNYPDRDEVVCEEENLKTTPKKNEYEVKEPKQSFYDNLKLVIELHQEISQMIITKDDANKVRNVLLNIRLVMEQARQQLLLKEQANRDTSLYIGDFNIYLKAKDLFASSLMDGADYQLDLKNIDYAKDLYRFIVINFTEDRYKPYVKKAEFALEDMKRRQ